MSNLILLSENKDYKYLGIEAPKYAEDIRKVWDGISWEEEYRTIGIPIKGEFDILGVIGNGSEISEEMAFEIIDHPDKGYCVFRLKKEIKEKGIQIENPIQKPKEHSYPWGDNFSEMWDKSESFKKWQDSESKTVKLVIIKVKK